MKKNKKIKTPDFSIQIFPGVWATPKQLQKAMDKLAIDAAMRADGKK